MFVNKKWIDIYRGDITNLIVDVIVSSDDTRLKMDVGVSWRRLQLSKEETTVKEVAIALYGRTTVRAFNLENLLI